MRDRNTPPQFRPQSRRRTGDRNVETRDTRERFLIVCEGKETEPNYFNALIEDLHVSGRARGYGYNTLSLVTEAVRQKEAAEEDVQVWCVFDHDSFKHTDFNSAIAKAKSAGLKIAYSNECFELWYVLHFQYHDAASARGHYITMLHNLLGRRYEKNDPAIYDHLLPHQSDAIRYAEKLMAHHGPVPPAQANPSTTVHLLVKELNKSAAP